MAHRLTCTLIATLAMAFVLSSAPFNSGETAAAKKSSLKLPLKGRKQSRWKLKHRSEFSDPTKTFKTWLTQRDDWIKGDVPYSNLEGAPYRSSNVNVSGGAMRLSIYRNDRALPSLTTGSVNARNRLSFRYGYIEARILVPACSGCWPAFWLLPHADHWPPEIDIFEFVDTAKMTYPWSAVHWPSKTPGQKEDYSSKKLSPTYGGNYTSTWHRYGMLWDRYRVRMYLDGRAGPTFKKRSAIPRLRMYPIIHLAVGNGYQPAHGSTMLVDYVRLWQRKRR